MVSKIFKFIFPLYLVLVVFLVSPGTIAFIQSQACEMNGMECCKPLREATPTIAEPPCCDMQQESSTLPPVLMQTSGVDSQKIETGFLFSFQSFFQKPGFSFINQSVFDPPQIYPPLYSIYLNHPPLLS